MAGLWAWPLLLWVTLAGERPHALVRKHKHRREPCDQAPDDSVATCEEELATHRAELADCQAQLADLEAHSAAEREALRAEWQEVTAEVAEISEQVATKETELDQLEAENAALHAELIEALGSIGLLQMNRTDPAAETDRWLACLDEKTSVELEARSCTLTISTTTARMTSQRQHYESLKEAAQQNVNMVTSRLRIVEQMIASATARKIKLTEQVSQVKALAGASFAVVGTRQSRGHVRGGRRGNASEAAAPSAEETAAAHRRAAQEADPIAEARERLKTIDAEIEAMREEVELKGTLRAAARDAMGAEAKVQTKVAGKLRKVRAETMEAFRKAFELDLQLDQLEALHDDAYVAARNATAAWEAAARAEHEAMAELQTLVTQKHRYEAIVQRAEDPARLESAEPAWAREDEDGRAYDEDEPRRALAPGAAVLALLLAAA